MKGRGLLQMTTAQVVSKRQAPDAGSGVDGKDEQQTDHVPVERRSAFPKGYDLYSTDRPLRKAEGPGDASKAWPLYFDCT